MQNSICELEKFIKLSVIPTYPIIKFFYMSFSAEKLETILQSHSIEYVRFLNHTFMITMPYKTYKTIIQFGVERLQSINGSTVSAQRKEKILLPNHSYQTVGCGGGIGGLGNCCIDQLGQLTYITSDGISYSFR